MADVHSPEMRSYNMSRVRSKDTKPELVVRKFLHGKGLRYRLHVKRLPGKPDIVLAKYRTVIFVHGCFWHGHKGCRWFVVPKTRSEWWVAKINANKNKDLKVAAELQKLGWRVIEIWECELKKAVADQTLQRLLRELREGLLLIQL